MDGVDYFVERLWGLPVAELADDELLRLYEQESEREWKRFVNHTRICHSLNASPRSIEEMSKVPNVNLDPVCILGVVVTEMNRRAIAPPPKTFEQIKQAKIAPYLGYFTENTVKWVLVKTEEFRRMPSNTGKPELRKLVNNHLILSHLSRVAAYERSLAVAAAPAAAVPVAAAPAAAPERTLTKRLTLQWTADGSFTVDVD